MFTINKNHSPSLTNSLLLTAVIGILFLSGTGIHSTSAANSDQIETESTTYSAKLPPHSFLAAVRHAFEGKVWGDFSGRVQHRSPTAQISTTIEVAVQIEAPEFMRARIVLHQDAVYDITRRLKNGVVDIEEERPHSAKQVTMSRLGMETDDLLFAFLYWRLIKEEEPETVRGRPCRVMLLQEPETGQRLRVWFSQEHLAPLRIVWLDEGEAEKTLEMTDFASRRGVWYVKSFLLTGDDWQTRVRFLDGSLFAHEHRTPPRNLFPRDP